MDVKADVPLGSRPGLWRSAWRLRLKKLKSAIPFAAGILAALLGVWIYSTINPPPRPMTAQDVNAVVALAMASATPPPAFSEQVYHAILPSLVMIQEKTLSVNGAEENGLGSGVIISDQGEILTALHVVQGATHIQVTFADGAQSSAKIAFAQPENDIAVIQPDQLPTPLVPAVLGNPNAMQIGDDVYAVGNPFGLYGSISAGVISGLNRTFHAQGSNQVIKGLIQVDAAVNPGNSGGPLLNRDGQVIGIVVGILNPTQQDVFIGIGFAVPITTASSAAGAPQD